MQGFESYQLIDSYITLAAAGDGQTLTLTRRYTDPVSVQQQTLLVTQAGSVDLTVASASGDTFAVKMLHANPTVTLQGSIRVSTSNQTSSSATTYGVLGSAAITEASLSQTASISVTAGGYGSAVAVGGTSIKFSNIAGSVSASGSGQVQATGLKASGNVTVTTLAGSITATSTKYAYGIDAGGAISFITLKGSVTAIGNDNAATALWGRDGVSIRDFAAGGQISASGGAATGIEGATIAVTSSKGTLSVNATSGSAYGWRATSTIEWTDLAGAWTISGVKDTYGMLTNGNITGKTFSGKINLSASNASRAAVFVGKNLTLTSFTGGVTLSAGYNPSDKTVGTAAVAIAETISITGIQGNAVLTARQSTELYGLKASATLTVGSFDASWTLSGARGTFGFYSDGALTITNFLGSLGVTGGGNYAIAGIRGNSIKIDSFKTGSGSTARYGSIIVSGAGETSGIHADGAIAFKAFAAKLNVESSNGVAYGIRGRDVTFTALNGAISVKGRSAYGIYASGNLTAGKADIALSVHGTTDSYAYGLYSAKKISIDALTGHIYTLGEGRVRSTAIFGGESITIKALSGNVIVNSSTGGSYVPTNAIDARQSITMTVSGIIYNGEYVLDGVGLAEATATLVAKLEDQRSRYAAISDDILDSVHFNGNAISGGSGNDSITVAAGALLLGSIALGGGSDTLVISNQARIYGGISGDSISLKFRIEGRGRNTVITDDTGLTGIFDSRSISLSLDLVQLKNGRQVLVDSDSLSNLRNRAVQVAYNNRNYTLTVGGAAVTIGLWKVKLELTAGASDQLVLSVTGGPQPDLYLSSEGTLKAPMVISTDPNGKLTGPIFYAADNLYLSLNLANGGQEESESFTIQVLIDGAEHSTIVVDSLDPGEVRAALGLFDLGTLSSGTHTITVVLDPDNWISESNEDNNVYNYTLEVMPSVADLRLMPYADDVDRALIVSTWDDITVYNAEYYSDQNLYLSMGVENAGREAAGEFTVQIIVDGVEFDTITVDGLDALASTSIISIDLGQLDAGRHKIIVNLDPENVLDESVRGNNSYYTTIDVREASTSGVHMLAYDPPTAEYMYGCTPTAAGMIMAYYDLHGVVGSDGRTYSLSNLIDGATAQKARGSDGDIYNMNEWDTWPGTVIATKRHVGDFFEGVGAEYDLKDPISQLNYTFKLVDGEWVIDTSGWECLADFMGTNQLWRGTSEAYGSLVYEGTNRYWGNFTLGESGWWADFYEELTGDDRWYWRILNTGEKDEEGEDILISRKIDYRYSNSTNGIADWVASRGYALNPDLTVSVWTDTDGGSFTFEDYKREIDAGRPVLIGITGHSMIGYGYDANTREIIFDDTYLHDQRMKWDGTYNYAGANRKLESITVIAFDYYKERSTAANDVSGNGFSDVISVSGTRVSVLSNQGDENFTAKSLTAAPTGWVFQATGDFNGDGYSDVLWRDMRNDTGHVYAWLMNPDYTYTQVVMGGAEIDEWNIVGAGDFNGDGTDDVLWLNSQTGLMLNWQVKDGVFSSNCIIAGAAPGEWKFAGVGDFNGDGVDDILWHNQESGLGGYWAVKDGTYESWNDLAGAYPDEWEMIGIGDFDANGYDDVLWLNKETGLVGCWANNFSGQVEWNSLAGAGDLAGWRYDGIGDYNGDGRDDVLWRHTSGLVCSWITSEDRIAVERNMMIA